MCSLYILQGCEGQQYAEQFKHKFIVLMIIKIQFTVINDNKQFCSILNKKLGVKVHNFKKNL